MHSGNLWILSLAAVTTMALPESWCTEGFQDADVIQKDIAIIGGGATGTYSAVRLRDDFGQSVVLIEKEARLGGHTQTYVDPTTRIPVEIGVQAYHNLSAVTNFFARFNVALTTAPTPPFQNQYTDLATGRPVAGYPAADPTAALFTYAVLAQRYSYLVGGYSLPDPVPADLLLPFGEFVAKYKVEAAVPTLFAFVSALGDVLQEPTIYVLQNFGSVQLQSLQDGFLVPQSHSNSELYGKAQSHLGADVLLESTPTQVCREVEGYNYVVVQTPQGRKLIRARKLLVTIPPVSGNMQNFDLDRAEIDVFFQFRASTYYTGLVRNTGIPDGVSVVNTGNSTPLHLPRTPFVETFSFTGVPGLHQFNYISDDLKVNDNQAKIGVIKSVLALRAAGTFPTRVPEFPIFSSHTPLQIRVDAETIRGGFYRRMYALQGHRSTFYTGAAWAADDTSILWTFTEMVLPLILDS